MFLPQLYLEAAVRCCTSDQRLILSHTLQSPWRPAQGRALVSCLSPLKSNRWFQDLTGPISLSLVCMDHRLQPQVLQLIWCLSRVTVWKKVCWLRITKITHRCTKYVHLISCNRKNIECADRSWIRPTDLGRAEYRLELNSNYTLWARVSGC